MNKAHFTGLAMSGKILRPFSDPTPMRSTLSSSRFSARWDEPAGEKDLATAFNETDRWSGRRGARGDIPEVGMTGFLSSPIGTQVET